MQSRRNIGKPERYKDDEHELHLVDTGDTESLFICCILTKEMVKINRR